MGREDGFVVADVSSGHFDDKKVRALWRRLSPDVPAMCEAMAIHLATVLESWQSGRRVTAEEAAPLWLPVRPELVAHLVAVRLLDRSGRVPMASWTDWYGTANARREARRESGRLGGLASGKHRRSDATASPNPTGRQAGPTVQTDRTVAREPRRRPSGREARGPSSLGEALASTPLGIQFGITKEAK